MGPWYDEEGWPVEYPKMLMAALRTIPGSEILCDTRIRALADLIEAVSDGGLDAELPRNKAAKSKKTEQEIRTLSKLCEKLADHIVGLHHPAVSALSSEGLDVFPLLNELRVAQETADYTYGGDNSSDRQTGPEKIQAAELTKITGKIYTDISGKRPTFTTNPETSEISGAWPEVLKLVFDALYIQASVSSQVRALSKKNLQK